MLQGFGSGNPSTEEQFTDAVHTTFEGRALAIVRPTAAGSITLTATAAGCDPVSLDLTADR